MRLLDWAQARPYAAAALAGLAFGCLVGFAWPIDIPPAGSTPADQWQRPAELAHARGKESEFSAVRDAPIWGLNAPGLNGAPVDKKTVWRLTGIIADPAPGALVIQDGSAEMSRLRVGAALPDGGIIKEITSSSVVFERTGCVYERLLYGPVLAEENAPCNPGERPAK